MLDMFLEMDSEDMWLADDGYDCDLGMDDAQDIELEVGSTCATLFDCDSTEISFRGNDDYYQNYYQKKVEHAIDQQNWNLERAEIALRRGQKTLYKDHLDRAEIWAKRTEQYQSSLRVASKRYEKSK